jgi:hypothetical protein
MVGELAATASGTGVRAPRLPRPTSKTVGAKAAPAIGPASAEST